MNRVLLLDLDGVLVEPRGYRAAIRETMAWFYRAWGWRAPFPTEADIAAFEARGVTSEWDMVPLMLAWVAEAFLRHHPPEDLPALFPEAPAPRVRATVWPPPFRDLVVQAAPHFARHEEPARALLLAMQEAPEATPFPRLARTPWAEGLLAATRDVYRAPTTQVFQHFALGSEGFAHTYGLPARFPAPSLLAQEDRPLLSGQAAARLRAGMRAGRWRLVVFTRRPSRPQAAGLGYPPEAELALTRVGLPDVPLLGQGHVAFWAAARGLPYEAYLKPAPFHALAALFLAWAPEDLPLPTVLDAAFRCLTANEPPPAWFPRRMEVWVVEDTPVGVQAAREAAGHLQHLGLEVRLRPRGVATAAEKQQRLQELGLPVATTPDEALAELLAGS